MSNTVFVSGDFCSGTTLLFTLLRATGEYHCLYEPLHERLPEYLIRPPRTYEHHYFAGHYFVEYKGFREVRRLLDPRWSISGQFLSPEGRDDRLKRYVDYLIDQARARRDKVLLKDNRFQFRLGWLRANYPTARFVHISRRPEDQWRSMVKRAQQEKARHDVGQDSVDFHGFNLAFRCEDLVPHYPQLHRNASSNGYERFVKLWEVSDAAQRRYADISIDFSSLTHDFETTATELRAAIGCDHELLSLRHLVVDDGHRAPLSTRHWTSDFIDRAGHRYAQARLWLSP